MNRIETYAFPNKLDKETRRPLMLWVEYETLRVGMEIRVTITIYGSKNPLPFKRVVTNSMEAARLSKWLREMGWIYLGNRSQVK